jgi:hypothetical protein
MSGNNPVSNRRTGRQAFGCDPHQNSADPIEDWERVATVHGESFRSIRPANTIMQVVRFIDPDWLVEIEADAVMEGEKRSHR